MYSGRSTASDPADRMGGHPRCAHEPLLGRRRACSCGKRGGGPRDGARRTGRGGRRPGTRAGVGSGPQRAHRAAVLRPRERRHRPAGRAGAHPVRRPDRARRLRRARTHRPDRRGPRSAAGGRHRRGLRGAGADRVRSVGCGGADGGLQGLRQGRHARRRRAYGARRGVQRRTSRPPPTCASRARRSSSRPTAWRRARGSSSPRRSSRPTRHCAVLRRPGVRRGRGHRAARGVPGGRGALAAGHRQRRPGGCRSPRPRTTSASSTATRGPNTGRHGVATRRCPASTPALYDEVVATAIVPTVAELAAPGHRLPGRALRGHHADGRGTQGARVQLPLRRSRRPRRSSPACGRDLLELLWAAARGESLPAGGVDRGSLRGCRAGVAGLPGVEFQGRRHHRVGRGGGAAGGRGVPFGDGVAGGARWSPPGAGC